MSKKFDFENIQVIITWQEYLPKGKEPSSEEAVIIFPGWPLKETPLNSVQKLGEEFANNSGARTYIIFTHSRQIITHPAYQESLAVCKLLEEKKLKSIIVVGYSQGGIKAIDTLILLQEMNQDICIKGLILVNTAGLNNIANHSFITRQLVDLLFIMWLIILRDSVREPSLRDKFRFFKNNVAVPIHGSRDFFSSVLRDARPSVRNFFSRFIREVDESTKLSPYLDKIKVPVIIIQGTEDRSFNTNKILIQSKDLQMLSRNTHKQVSVVDLFPNSPYIRLVRAQKLGIHLLPLLRPKAVSQVSLNLLKKFQICGDFWE